MNIPVLRRRHRSNGSSPEVAEPEVTGAHLARQSRAEGAEVSSRAPAGWSPWAEFNALYERMGRLMTDVWAERAEDGWRPAADVEETGDAYLVEVELPGVKREDVSVELGGGELTISGELKERHRVGFLRTRTRPVGRFHYRVRLAAQVDDGAVTASLSDGVLTVRVPKAATARSRRIPVAS